MQALPWDKPGRFWRGNLHTHSTVSDGRLTVEQVCQFYRENGYDFLALTDHFMERFGWQIADTRPHRTSAFTTLIGAELHADGIEFGGYPWHILAVGLPTDFAPTPDDEYGPALAQRALSAGAFVAIAHPEWYNLTESDALSLGKVHAVEVFNGTSMDHNDKPGGWSMLDILLARGHRYNALATDDAHFFPERDDHMLGWTMVKCENLSPEALLEALIAGHYYSSTGPAIHEVRVTADSVFVRCSPAERIFVTGTAFTSSYAFGRGITEAEIPLGPLRRYHSPFARITVRDRNGGRAWSNPFWF